MDDNDYSFIVVDCDRQEVRLEADEQKFIFPHREVKFSFEAYASLLAGTATWSQLGYAEIEQEDET